MWHLADPFDCFVLTWAAVFLAWILFDAGRAWWRRHRSTLRGEDWLSEGGVRR